MIPNGNQELSEIAENIARWFKLDLYTVLAEGSAEALRLKRETTLGPSLEPLIQKLNAQVKERIDSQDHDEALALAKEALVTVEKLCTGDSLIAGRVAVQRTIGFVYEHRALRGDLAKDPTRIDERVMSFLRAANHYILSDLETGYASDYGLRISECFVCADMPEFRNAALEKCFEGRPFTVIGKTPENKVFIQALKNRAIKTKSLGGSEVIKGAEMLYIDLPDSGLN